MYVCLGPLGSIGSHGHPYTCGNARGSVRTRDRYMSTYSIYAHTCTYASYIYTCIYIYIYTHINTL